MKPKYPPIPAKLSAPAGEVEILRPVMLRKKEGAVGIYEHQKRQIRVQGSLPRRHSWEVFLHEWAHVAIADSGIRCASEEEEERWADCMSAAFMHIVTHLVTPPE